MPSTTTRLGPSDVGDYRAFKLRQGIRILQNGGSQQDVVNYWNHLDEKPGVRRAIETPVSITRQDQGLSDVPGLLGVPMHFVQSVTFGFGDEAFGTLAGVLSPELSTQQGRNDYRAVLDAYAQENPKTTIAAQIAGAIALGVTLPTVTAVSGVPNALVGAGVGAGSAAAFGAGTAVGGVGERAKAATDPTNLAVGALAGAAAAPLLRGAGRVATAVTRPVVRATKRATGSVARTIEHLAEQLPGSPSRQARAALREALEADGITPSQAAAAVRARVARGNAVSVGDIGGSNTGALITSAQKFQGPAQQQFSNLVRAQQIAADPRRLAELGRRLRMGSDNIYDTVDRVLAQQQTLSEPLYRQAYQASVQLTPRVRALFEIPEFRRAYEAGRSLAMVEEQAGLNAGLKIPELGDDIPASLPVRALDYVKKGINALTQTTGAEGKPVLSRQMSRAMGRTLREALKDIDEQVPVYAQARSVYRGFEEILESVEDGYGGTVTGKGLSSQGQGGFLSRTPQEVQREIAALDPSLRPYYRMGAVQSIADALRGPGAESVGSVANLSPKSLFADRQLLQKIGYLFDDAQMARQFVDYIAGEATALRMAQAARPRSPQPRSALREVAPQGRVGAVVSRFTGGRRDITRGQMLGDEIVALFMKGVDDPNELIAMLESLNSVGLVPRGRTSISPRAAQAARVVAGERSR